MKVKFWGTRGSIPTPVSSAAMVVLYSQPLLSTTYALPLSPILIRDTTSQMNFRFTSAMVTGPARPESRRQPAVKTLILYFLRLYKRRISPLLPPACRLRLISRSPSRSGPVAPIKCVSQMAYEPCGCPDEQTCGLRLVMGDVRSAISQILDECYAEAKRIIVEKREAMERVTQNLLQQETLTREEFVALI